MGAAPRPTAQADGNICLRGAVPWLVRLSALRLPFFHLFSGGTGIRLPWWQSPGADASRERFSISSLPGLTRLRAVALRRAKARQSMRRRRVNVGCFHLLQVSMDHRVKPGGDEGELLLFRPHEAQGGDRPNGSAAGGGGGMRRWSRPRRSRPLQRARFRFAGADRRYCGVLALGGDCRSWRMVRTSRAISRQVSSSV